MEKPPQGPYTGPPPIGYPTRDVMLGDPPAAAVETKSKGDGFWKGWYIHILSIYFYMINTLINLLQNTQN